MMKRFWKWVMILALIGGTPSFHGHASEALGLDVAVDPYAFFVGRVTRSFVDDLRGEALQDEASLHRTSPHEASSHEASSYEAPADGAPRHDAFQREAGPQSSGQHVRGVDLGRYIDHANRRITSVTGQAVWDYGIGVATINTPTSQGAAGVLNALPQIELDDVIIRSQNEFATVVVVSLDGEPLSRSSRLLIQAMTEDKPYGFVARPVFDEQGQTTGQQEIVALGSGLLNVRNIEATVLLKDVAEEPRVFSVDVNGYHPQPVQGELREDGFLIRLPSDRIYTIVERGPAASQGKATPLEAAQPDADHDASSGSVYVWWEAEDAESTNFPRRSGFSVNTMPEAAHLLSGGDWLSVDAFPTSLNVRPFAKYVIEVPEDGEYAFYVRKFWKHGPFRWRFDDGEWRYVGRDITLLDDTPLRQFVNANWVALGTVLLTKGTHAFEFELTPEEGRDTYIAAFDAFLLTKAPFSPRGSLKPGEKLALAEEGWWPFEPDTDLFHPTPIDLRHLNEPVAGQSGFVRKEGDRLVRGDGEPIRFWGVNVGIDVINLERPDVDYLARQLAKYGVNLVRIHGRIFDDHGHVDPVALDRYHYFVHALKQQGIYVALSYYFVLWIESEPFGLLLFDPEQQEAYRQGVRNLLRAPNPYEGGTPLAKDPAVAIIEIQNEDSYLFWTFDVARYSDGVKRELYRRFGQWLIEKYGSLDEAYRAWGTLGRSWEDDPEQGLMEIEGIRPIPWATGDDGDSRRRRDSLAWMVEAQRAFYEEMTAFLREEIGTPSLIVASNWITADPQKLEALERYTYAAADIVDRHAYFESSHVAKDNMFWLLQAGDRYTPQPAVRNPGLNPVKIVHNQGQPSMISEITWTHPTPYGAEGPYFLSVYGSLQGIDALVTFAVGKPGWESSWKKWPVMTPTMLGQFPAFALMYRRGDVAEGDVVLHETNSLKALLELRGSAVYESLNLDDARK